MRKAPTPTAAKAHTTLRIGIHPQITTRLDKPIKLLKY
jgi:hypothetical protein